MRYKMYAAVLASVMVIASTGCQAISMKSCESGSITGSCNQASCGCQNCQHRSQPGMSNGYENGSNAFAHQGNCPGGLCQQGNCQNGMCDPSLMGGAHAAGFAGQGGGNNLSGCPSCSQLGRPCANCLAAGGRLAGGAAGKARGLFGSILNRCAAHDCQTPHTQPFAESGLPGGPLTATYGYPYYTTRAPRDFFTCNPPSIGP